MARQRAHGATGYLGGYLGRELLAAGAHVWCPVQGPDAAVRLRERLSTLGVPPGVARLAAIEANLAARSLGSFVWIGRSLVRVCR
ncbi:hypothetical protein ACF1BE_34845 [Streptomyces sp. NPDC014991]|uniref:hypothetical protein n=1 Tax=Streptomyces sp. NPDC014991 TaxID=3364935 RepID=UPI00370199A1